MTHTWEREEPRKVLSGFLAVGVHLLFLVVLVFSVSWQNKDSGPVMADVWTELPGPARPRAVEPPPPPPEPEPVPKKTEPTPAPKEPLPTKADIELKARQEKEAKLKEERLRQEKLEQEKKKQDEQKRREQEKALQRQQAAQESAARQQRAAQQAAMGRLVNDYKGRIQGKIKRYVVLPPDMSGNPQAEFDVTLMPTGEVLSVRLVRSSGVPAYDSAVERAIYKAQPLPLPPDPALFSQFRELRLQFRPFE